MKIIYADGKKEYEFLREMELRNGDINVKTNEAVFEIIKNVKNNGDEALKEYGIKFDGAFPDSLEVTKEEMEYAFEQADNSFKEALYHAKRNITEYHEKQIKQGYEIKRQNGALLGQIIRGLEKVGIYVPGGTAAYPSTVLMNAIPAKLAGVKEIIMVTPPLIEKQAGKEIICKANKDILAAAYIAGVDRVFLTGSAQAVAALTYGTDTVPRVDKIVGPGNIFVATAKKLLYGQVDIDMIAGPSEILVIADESANPKFIAADLMSQAEHDKLASAVLLTTSKEIADKTLEEIDKQKKRLNRIEILEQSLTDFGAVIICKDAQQMIEISDIVAPEHLEIMTKNPMEYLEKIKNAGSVFCGEYAPEPLGDYLSGTNHVLPTSGTARFASPLGVDSFIKKMSYTFYTKEALLQEKDDIIIIADKEGLDAHANSIKVRFE